jgi:hypothetical protein
MKTANSLLTVCAASLLTGLLAGCNYTKPFMYIDLANRSGATMRNIELKHPTGIVGLPQLRDGQTHQHMAPIGAPCTFSLSFEDQSGKSYHKDFDLGEKCPLEVAFDVSAGMQVSERTERQ